MADLSNPHLYKFTAGPNDALFALYWSHTTKRPRVRLIEPDDSPHWDYDDETDAQTMSRPHRHVRFSR